ncbi:MAG: type protein, partial [Candidatus Poribacteria bacterium]|nr:type protein [Candidatus Poribacteria bacterium]
MDLRIIVSLGLLGILGFLFYPHGAGQFSPTNDVEWVAIKNTLDNEPLREAKLKKDNPVIKTYDLGFIYRIDRAEILFNGMPKDYDILTCKVKNTQEYDRAISASATSREHFYPITTFPPKESRWIQVVVNDWYEAQPPQVSSMRIGARYKKHNSISNVRTRYNQYDAFLLFDGLKSEPARKWIGAKRVEREVKKDKTTVKEVGYETLGRDGLDITFDLGGSKHIYGVGMSNGGPENNLKQYKLSLSSDDENYQTVYTSPELENKYFTDSHTLDKTYQARYARITVPPGGWYGKYPEIREVEIYTDEYRPSSYNEPIENNNASQVCYDNCGILENKLAPHLIQGFPFDRGEDSDPQTRHSFKPGDEVDPANSPEENSFCYHYDSVIFSYSNLDPGALYWVQVTYLQEKDGKRIQNLVADGFILHDPMVIPANTANKFTYAIQPEAYNDGKMELHFNRIAGPNAVVSEVMLYRASKGNSIPVTYQGGKTGADMYARAPIATTPIVIDGNLDEWSNIYPIAPQGFTDNPSISPCQIYAQWDTDNLYFALKTDRAKLKKLSSSPDILNSTDTLHLFIDTAFGSSKNVYKANNYHFTFSNLGAIDSDKKAKDSNTANVIVSQIHHYVDSIPRNIENRKDIEVAERIIPETSEYILEVRIPKGTVIQDYSPQQGGFIGFNYILSNPYIVERDDDPQKTVIKGFEPLFWSAASRDAAPMFWGKLELIGSISGQTTIMDRNMTKKLTSFNAGDNIALTVIDPDRNTDINSSQTITVRVSGNLTNDSKEVTLYETLPLLKEEQTKGDQPVSMSDIDIQPANDSPFFAGKLKTQFGTAPSDDPMILTVQGKELVTLEYIDPYYGPNQTNVKVTYTATAKIGTNGSLQILSRSGKEIKQFPAGLRLFFKVQDDDLIRLEGEVQSEPAKVVITITSKTDSEQVTLVDEKNTGTFIGSLETAYNTTANKGDGILQIVGSETIKALYVDTLQASGNNNVSVETSANVDFGNDGNITIGKSDLVPPSNGRIETNQPEDFVKINSFNAGDILTIIVKDADLNRDKSAVEQAEAKIEDEQNK